jgi:hypothetical protein
MNSRFLPKIAPPQASWSALPIIDENGLVTSAAGLPSLIYSGTVHDDQNQLCRFARCEPRQDRLVMTKNSPQGQHQPCERLSRRRMLWKKWTLNPESSMVSA